MKTEIIAGVDGCRAGWFAIEEDLGSAAFRSVIAASFKSLLSDLTNCSVIAIDIPIGMPRFGLRSCDLLARKLLGPGRGSSVFPAPIRAVLAANTHGEASGIRKSVDGKGMSIQSFALLIKIREVDEAVRRNVDAQKIIEVHPEVSFTAMAGGTSMRNRKARVAGRNERISHLSRYFSADVLETGLGAYARGAVAKDDILDAFAALWTARRVLDGAARRFPDCEEQDEFGLDMTIWC